MSTSTTHPASSLYPQNISTHGHTGAGETSGTDTVVKTGDYATGIERAPIQAGTTTAVPVVGNSYQNRVSGVATAPGVIGAPGSGDGLVVNNGLGGPLGGAVVLGGQCECTRNGGSCNHGAGKCICRGCTTRATTVNPGINLGVSTTQYTAPVGTTGIGGGVADPGVGIAGLVNPVNASGAQVCTTDGNCDCVKKNGICNCGTGACKCENCAAKRSSLQHASTAQGHHHHHHQPHHPTAAAVTTTSTTTHHQHLDQGHANPIAGSEYVGNTNHPDAAYKSSSSSTTHTVTTGSSSGPLTDNSNVSTPYKKGDYMEGKPVTNSTSGVV